ncbi:MAG: ABC transporter permease [Bacteroidota bacterium]
MNVLNVLKVASRSLGRNKMRSFLTMLGIIIGVAAVIAMLAIGQGARYTVESQIASLGTNMLIVFPFASSQGGVRFEAGTSIRLTDDDAIAIRDQCSAVQYISPFVRSSEQVVAGDVNWRTQIQGVLPEYLSIRDWPLQSGNVFTDSDVRAATKVCILGQTVVKNLFGDNADPIGQTIRIRRQPFKVIGTLIAKGQSATGQDQDDFIIAPFSTVQKKLLGITWVNTIYVSAISQAAIYDAQNQITDLLRSRHRLLPWEDNDFTVRNQTDIASTAESTSKTLTVLLAAIASVSLIVGGIGIMNIMLVSVTERTREIGIRMSIGARSKDILFQFLIEATVLSLFGGLLGVGLGVASSYIISSTAGWPVLVSGFSVGLSSFFAAAIGVFFGFYPARKASLLNPIDALRYE